MLDIKTVTGGPLDVNTYVVALDGGLRKEEVTEFVNVPRRTI